MHKTDRRGLRIVTISYSREELMEDITSYAGIEADMADEDVDKTLVADITDTGNIDRVDRVIMLAYMKLVNMFFPFSKQPLPPHHECGCRYERSSSEYVIKLDVPATISATQIGEIEQNGREYIVCSVLADWLMTSNPKRTEVWTSRIVSAEDRIRSALCKRMQPVRRKIQPF